jgi:hypothetical protein
MGFEQEIFAQVSTEYRDYSNSELSSVGGGAFTPAIDSAPEPHIWTGTYDQLEYKGVVMKFDFFSVTDEVVTG